MQTARPWWVRVLALLLLASLSVAVYFAYRKEPRSPTAIARAAEEADPELAKPLREIDRIAVELVDQYPESPQALEVLARAHYRLTEYKAAEAYWQECLKLDPEFTPAAHAIGLVNLETGNNEKAAKYFRRALDLDPTFPSFAVELSQALLANGEMDEAVEILRQDVQRHPRSVATLAMLGQALVQARQFKEAKQYLLKTIEIDPTFSGAYNNLVAVCANLDQDEEAKRYAAQLKKLKEGEEQSHRDMLSKHKEVKKTEGILAEVCTSAANVHLTHNRPEPAEALLKKAIETSSDFAPAHEILAWLYQKQGREQETRGVLRRLIKITPDDVAKLLSAAKLCEQAKMFPEAERAYRRSIELAPKQPQPRAALAWLYIKQETNPKRIHDLAEQVVSLEPSGEYYYLLGVACQINGDRKGAREAVEQARALDPSNPEYRRVERILEGNAAAGSHVSGISK